MLPNRPGASDQSLLVLRGERQVLACMSWQGLKQGKVPCGFAWRRMDEMLRGYVPMQG